MSDTIELLGFPIRNATGQELLADWRNMRFLLPVNVDVLMKLHRNRTFAEALAAAGSDVTLVNDSQVLVFASRLILGKRFRGRVSGSDFLPSLCTDPGAEDARVFLLGGLGDAAQQAQARLNAAAGRTVVVEAHSPSFGFERDEAECLALVRRINESGANVLAVGVGAPKQELWMLRHADGLTNISLFVAVGATIDFAAGKVSRAPRWISNAGLEWLYRLVREPRRLARRYLVEGPPIFWLLLRQRLGFGVERNRA